jgi:hypothetical protein
MTQPELLPVTKHQESCASNPDLPMSLQADHLRWMSEHIARHAEDWPATRLHRWIGFVQCGMMANGMLDLHEAKAMFTEIRNAYGGNGPDLVLIDHLDPTTDFELEIGGEG